MPGASNVVIADLLKSTDDVDESIVIDLWASTGRKWSGVASEPIVVCNTGLQSVRSDDETSWSLVRRWPNVTTAINMSVDAPSSVENQGRQYVRRHHDEASPKPLFIY